MGESDQFYFSVLDEVIKETLDTLPYMAEVFLNPDYDLKETVENDTDFLLGAVLSQIIQNISRRYALRNISGPSDEQAIKINRRLFSKAPEIRAKLFQILGH
jgi:hypothetical protein